jgi:23S rRNA pseudouridine955/2504/2580 synthase
MDLQSKTRAGRRSGEKAASRGSDRATAPRKAGAARAPAAANPPPPAAPAAVRYLTVGPEQAGQRLDNFLLRLAKGVPKSHVYRIVRSGEVRVNRGRAEADRRLQAGDELRIPPLRVAAGTPPAQPAIVAMPPILFEDEHLLVVDKPSGVAAHGGSGIAHGLIERVRAARPNQPFLELGHRLDRETSGVLVLAKSRRALLGLHLQMREGQVDKRYLVLVAGDWVNERQHVRLALKKYVNASGERRVVVDGGDGAAAHTVFTLKARLRGFSLLEAELKTGRTHQIRVHLAHLGFPIVGDDKYGDFELNRRAARGEFGARLGRMFLHAASTRLSHPVGGEPIAIDAALPPECAAFLHGIR